MKYSKWTMLISLLFLNGCGTAWVKSQYQDGGVIGYRGFNSNEGASAAIRNLINCGNYEMVSDELKSSEFQYSTITPVTTNSQFNGSVNNAYGSQIGSYSAENTQTTYVPTTGVGTAFWREFTYHCTSSNRSPSSNTRGNGLKVSDSDFNRCNKNCYDSLADEKQKYLECLAKCPEK